MNLSLKIPFRSVAGFSAALLLVYEILNSASAPFLEATIYGAGWGTSLLFGVQGRVLLRGESAATWSGALTAMLLWK